MFQVRLNIDNVSPRLTLVSGILDLVATGKLHDTSLCLLAFRLWPAPVCAQGHGLRSRFGPKGLADFFPRGSPCRVNDYRAARTDAQRAKGINQMLLAGVTPAKVAKTLSMNRHTVNAAADVAKSPTALVALRSSRCR
ncbi:MAG: hypothetical protein QOJ80_560 [Mycobacterium sp.]|nr:hypothetical protein [Mycobacterium sp.]